MERPDDAPLIGNAKGEFAHIAAAQRQPQASPMRRVLFLCSQNRLRSPTAEQVFASWPGIEVASAGLNASADNPVTPDLVEWAQIIFVMEKQHRTKLSRRFRAQLKGQRVICLNIPDEYEYMDPRLIVLLRALVPRHLQP